jgi:hypothetical protein
MSGAIGSGYLPEYPVTTTEWWEARRLRYNLALIAAGIGSFLLYCIVCGTILERVVPPNEIEITIFTVLFQGVGYLLCMGLANVCYLLGPISETVIKPKEPDKFRSILCGSHRILRLAPI